MPAVRMGERVIRASSLWEGGTDSGKGKSAWGRVEKQKDRG